MIEDSPTTAHQSFTFANKTLDVERVGKSWRLRCGGQVVETRDLPGGVDELVGRGRGSLTLILSILEWNALRS